MAPAVPHSVAGPGLGRKAHFSSHGSLRDDLFQGGWQEGAGHLPTPRRGVGSSQHVLGLDQGLQTRTPSPSTRCWPSRCRAQTPGEGTQTSPLDGGVSKALETAGCACYRADPVTYDRVSTSDDSTAIRGVGPGSEIAWRGPRLAWLESESKSLWHQSGSPGPRG